MKLTHDLEKHIEKLVEHYSYLLSIEKPKYVLRVKDVLSLPKYITKGRRTSAYRYFGVAYIKNNYLFFNVKLLPTPSRLERTIVHELVHLRFPYLNHGLKFRERIRETMDGRKFKPYKKRNESIRKVG